MPKYDVAVIGAGLGGLAAAALLSNRKKKTVVLDRGPSLSDAMGVVEKNGFLFSARPSLVYGFEPGGAFQEFSTSLGLAPQTTISAPSYQVALPDHRISVFPEHDATLEELRREFPKEIDALAAFYRNLAKLSVRTRESRMMAYLARVRSAAGFMSSFPFSREVKAFFDIQTRWFFQRPVGDLSLQALITLCTTPPRRLHGGIKKLGEQLCGIVLREDGEVRYHEPSPELAFEAQRIIGVKTAQGVVEADTIILNALPSGSRSLVLVAVLEEVVPLGMSADVLFLPDYSRAQQFAALSLDTHHENALELAGSRSLTVSCASQQNTPEGKNASIQQVGRLMPFLSDFMFFAEEYDQAAGYTVLPGNLAVKPLRSKQEGAFRTSQKNVFVLHDRPEAPAQVIAAAQGLIEKLV